MWWKWQSRRLKTEVILHPSLAYCFPVLNESCQAVLPLESKEKKLDKKQSMKFERKNKRRQWKKEEDLN